MTHGDKRGVNGVFSAERKLSTRAYRAKMKLMHHVRPTKLPTQEEIAGMEQYVQVS